MWSGHTLFQTHTNHGRTYMKMPWQNIHENAMAGRKCCQPLTALRNAQTNDRKRTVHLPSTNSEKKIFKLRSCSSLWFDSISGLVSGPSPSVTSSAGLVLVLAVDGVTFPLLVLTFALVELVQDKIELSAWQQNDCQTSTSTYLATRLSDVRAQVNSPRTMKVKRCISATVQERSLASECSCSRWQTSCTNGLRRTRSRCRPLLSETPLGKVHFTEHTNTRTRRVRSRTKRCPAGQTAPRQAK